MNRVFKVIGSIIVSVAVLYYGIAWTFLRCSHEVDSFLNDKIELENSQSDHSHGSEATEIECFNGESQIAPFGQVSSTPRVAEFSEGVRITISSDAVTALQSISSWCGG